MRLSDSGAYVVDDTGHIVAAGEIMDALTALREENARLVRELLEAHGRLAAAMRSAERSTALRSKAECARDEARAEVARLEGLILAAHEGLDDYWVTLPEAQPILTEARRIRAEKGE